MASQKFDEKDYDRFLECIHCGFCLPTCPTYAELGNETDSPRGRIYFMKSLADGRLKYTPNITRHLDLCLGCTACETACPSGVHYGQLVEKARAVVEAECPRPLDERLLRKGMAAVFTRPVRLEAALLPVRALRKMGLGKVLDSTLIQKATPKVMKPMMSLLPGEVPPMKERRKLGEVIEAQGERKHRVAMLTGCVMSVMFSPTNAATARVLSKNGCEVVVPRDQVCCGALHAHLGYSEEAKELARKNIRAFAAQDVDAIVVNAAGCGAHMKQYGEMFADDPELREKAEVVAAKTRDISEFLASIDISTELGEVKARATYHDACHLAHAQKVVSQPRQLLSQIPGLELVPLNESDMCCGSAGPYNLVQPEMAARLQQRKIRNIRETGAEMVISGNPGCNIQIESGLKAEGLSHVEVAHTVDVLDRAYRAAGNGA